MTEVRIPLRRPTGDRFFYDRLRSACPQLSDDDARQIAEIWSEVLGRVITRMLEISGEAVGPSLHIEARTDAIFEMARLCLYLSEAMLAKKLVDESAIAGLTAPNERAAADSQHGHELVENTARNLATIWNSLVVKWRAKWPLIISAASEGRHKPTSKLRQSSKAPGVRNNHYSPASSNKPWASGAHNQVRAFVQSPDGTLKARGMSYRSWGREQFLYSLQLERYLSLVDDDGAQSRDKLLDVRPLTDLDKRRWIAFLIVQMLRTPACLRHVTENVKRVLPDVAPGYPSAPGALKAVYETLFTNDDVYARFHKQIAPRSWAILCAPAGSGFVRPDSTILVEGSVLGANWRVAYPMTPRKVFLVGPGMSGGYDRDFVESSEASAEQVDDLNRRFALSASASVLVHAHDDNKSMRALLKEHLATTPVASSDVGGLWGPLWSPV